MTMLKNTATLTATLLTGLSLLMLGATSLADTRAAEEARSVLEQRPAQSLTREQRRQERREMRRQARIERRQLQANRMAQLVLAEKLAEEAQRWASVPEVANDALGEALEWYANAAKRGYPGSVAVDDALPSFPVKVFRQ